MSSLGFLKGKREQDDEALSKMTAVVHLSALKHWICNQENSLKWRPYVSHKLLSCIAENCKVHLMIDFKEYSCRGNAQTNAISSIWKLQIKFQNLLSKNIS